MTIRMNFRSVLLLFSVLSLSMVIGAGSSIAKSDDVISADGITITDVDTSAYPRVRVGFGADTKQGESPDLHFFENGMLIPGISLYNGQVGNYEDARSTDVMLVLDTSLSMGMGTRLDDAIAASLKLIDHARPGDRIGLTTFGGDAKVILSPTSKLSKVRSALADVKLADRTTMFDAVSISARKFDKKSRNNRAIVLLSDGKDVGSVETLNEAAGEALKARAPIFAVAIREKAGDEPNDLAQLGNGSGGSIVTVVGSDGLDEVFADLGRRILQPYWVEYKSNAPKGRELVFGISPSTSSSDIPVKRTFRGVPSLTLSGAEQADLVEAKPAKPLVPMPGGLAGVLVASIPFSLLILSFIWLMLQRRTKPDVVARIERYTARANSDSIKRNDQAEQTLLKRLGAPIMHLSDSFLGKSAFFDRIRARTEQAAIPIKPNELFATMIATGAIGALVGLVFTPNLITALLTATFTWYLPSLWLRMKARSRRNRFDDQLPDVLQGISSSLKAGHSFNQALNAMIKDAPNPTSEEFSRVMTETRLGMPIEQALDHMSQRMNSPDFEFAVTTVNIQRTVGGSLADILQMVGDTVRNRQQFRKKVKALTSMGQLSAYVLLAMPFFMALGLTLMNREYMAPLFTTTIGHLMIAVGCFSMFLGYLACMKIVNVKI